MNLEWCRLVFQAEHNRIIREILRESLPDAVKIFSPGPTLGEFLSGSEVLKDKVTP